MNSQPLKIDRAANAHIKCCRCGACGSKLAARGTQFLTRFIICGGDGMLAKLRNCVKHKGRDGNKLRDLSVHRDRQHFRMITCTLSKIAISDWHVPTVGARGVKSISTTLSRLQHSQCLLYNLSLPPSFKSSLTSRLKSECAPGVVVPQ